MDASASGRSETLACCDRRARSAALELAIGVEREARGVPSQSSSHRASREAVTSPLSLSSESSLALSRSSSSSGISAANA
jgi:hypothetical protein